MRIVLKSFWSDAKRIYLKNQNKYRHHILFLHLTLATLITLHILCIRQTFLTLVGMYFMPYAKSFLLSLGFTAGSAFLTGLCLLRAAYSVWHRI